MYCIASTVSPCPLPSHRLLHVCRCVTSCVKGSGNPKGAPRRPHAPHGLAVKEILDRARHNGVLAQAASLGLSHLAYLLQGPAEAFFDKLLLDPECRLSWSPQLFPPSLFTMLKWKSVETGTSPLLKWREVIAFCAVPLKRYARIISRCLQVLVKNLYQAAHTYGFPLMLGTRDFARACTRLSTSHSEVRVMEKDMEDMYWTIPKPEFTTSFKWALRCVGKHRGNNVTVFAIHKGGDRMLDRLGKSAEDSFWNIPACFVDQYINWELYHNTLFVLGCMILEQGNAGVPIGGCLSAPKSEIWAVWREHQALHEQTAETQAEWQRIINSQDIDARVVILGVSQFHHLHHDPMHERFQNIWAHRQRDQAPDRQADRQSGDHSCLATAFWGPMESLIAWITVDGVEYPIVHTTLWDAAPEGRSQAIIKASPKRDHHRLKKYLAQFELSNFLLHEVFTPPHVDHPIPCCLVARFKDNVPLALIHTPQTVHNTLMTVLSAFLQAVYRIPLKWEPHTTVAQLCETELAPQTEEFMRRKGVVTKLSWPLRHDFEWQRWLPVTSPNAKDVLTSFLPSLLNKCLLYALNPLGLILNVRSLTWGLGWHNYPRQWWENAVKGFVKDLHLYDIFPLRDIDTWEREGKEFASKHKPSVPV